MTGQFHQHLITTTTDQRIRAAAQQRLAAQAAPPVRRHRRLAEALVPAIAHARPARAVPRH
ncbi:MAG: hypothetical protein QOJ07_141 [Thermoleophilaceae bacterium]|jgi:hypothetical protein|nr:hypothetical protein [Thermoleophilaceae bacterium]